MHERQQQLTVVTESNLSESFSEIIHAELWYGYPVWVGSLINIAHTPPLSSLIKSVENVCIRGPEPFMILGLALFSILTDVPTGFPRGSVPKDRLPCSDAHRRLLTPFPSKVLVWGWIKRVITDTVPRFSSCHQAQNFLHLGIWRINLSIMRFCCRFLTAYHDHPARSLKHSAAQPPFERWLLCNWLWTQSHHYLQHTHTPDFKHANTQQTQRDPATVFTYWFLAFVFCIIHCQLD